MKKKTTKTPPPKRGYSLRDDDRPYSIDLSAGEVIELANSHLRRAKGVPSRFAKRLADNPAIGKKDLKALRDHMFERIDYHLNRAEDLDNIVPDYPAKQQKS